jgi:hypothetical protein
MVTLIVERLLETGLDVTPVVSVEPSGKRVKIIQYGLQHLHFILDGIARKHHALLVPTGDNSTTDNCKYS